MGSAAAGNRPQTAPPHVSQNPRTMVEVLVYTTLSTALPTDGNPARNQWCGICGHQHSLAKGSMSRNDHRVAASVQQDDLNAPPIIAIHDPTQHRQSITMCEARAFLQKTPSIRRKLTGNPSIDCDTFPRVQTNFSGRKKIPSCITTEPLPGVGGKRTLNLKALKKNTVSYILLCLH